MKFTTAYRLLTLLSTAAFASASTNADDDRAVIRALMTKVDLMSAKLEEQDAKHATKLEEQAVKHAALSAEVASLMSNTHAVPKGNTHIRRGLQDAAEVAKPQDDAEVVEPVSLKHIVYALIHKIDHVADEVRAVHKCVDYDSAHDKCMIGGDHIDHVMVKADKNINLQANEKLILDAEDSIFIDAKDSIFIDAVKEIGLESATENIVLNAVLKNIGLSAGAGEINIEAHTYINLIAALNSIGLTSADSIFLDATNDIGLASATGTIVLNAVLNNIGLTSGVGEINLSADTFINLIAVQNSIGLTADDGSIYFTAAINVAAECLAGPSYNDLCVA